MGPGTGEEEIEREEGDKEDGQLGKEGHLLHRSRQFGMKKSARDSEREDRRKTRRLTQPNRSLIHPATGPPIAAPIPNRVIINPW